MSFYHTSPLCQYFLIDKGKEEYHIKLRRCASYCNAYKDNCNKDLWQVIMDCLLAGWKDSITEYGMDCTETNVPYIWIHVKQDESSFSIQQVIAGLNEGFEKEMSSNMLPKLLSILTRNL